MDYSILYFYKKQTDIPISKKDEAPVEKVHFIRFKTTICSDSQGYPFAFAEACGEQHKAAELV